VSELLTPKQVARAIGVSESSLKRWCDRGLIPMICTAGGHRRLPLPGVLEFIRAQQHALVRPEAIGLPLGTGQRKLTIAAAREMLTAGFVSGSELLCRQLILDQYLNGQRISVICDDLIAATFHEIGSQWECSRLEVYRERRACRICVRVLHELRTILPAVDEATAPTALGGTPAGDYYDLPTAMVELVLRQNGWQATSLGSALPLETVAVAITENRPRLFWLSVSHLADEQQFLLDYAALHAAAAGSTKLVVGGRALHEGLRAAMPAAEYCQNLQELEAYLARWPAPAPAAGPSLSTELS